MVSSGLPDALVFDLDGTIVDTETPEFEAIKAVWSANGQTYTMAHYEHVIGTVSANAWMDELVELVGHPIDAAAAEVTRRSVHRTLTAALVARPGIERLVEEASVAGVPMAVASNSPEWWVRARLEALNLSHHLSVMVTLDTSSRPKPHPAPFLEACVALGARPSHSVAFEDSSTGVASAVAAGLYTVACPGPLSRNHDLSAAHRVIDSHDEISLFDLGRAVHA